MADAAASELSNVPEDDRGDALKENAAAHVSTAYVVTEVPAPERRELEKTSEFGGKAYWKATNDVALIRPAGEFPGYTSEDLGELP